jgi:hypothetical protein
LREIEHVSFDWNVFVQDALPQLQTLAQTIAKMDNPAMLEHARSLPLLTRLNIYELWSSNLLTINSKKYMWTYLKNLHEFANFTNDIDAPDFSNLFGGPGLGTSSLESTGTGTGTSSNGGGGGLNNTALTDGIMKMMKNIDPAMISQIGEVMMKGMTGSSSGSEDGGGSSDASSNSVPDLSGISKILESINLPALSQSVLPAFANANETDMQNLFGGIEQVMSVLAKSEQFAGFTDQLTRSLEAGGSNNGDNTGERVSGSATTTTSLSTDDMD